MTDELLTFTNFAILEYFARRIVFPLAKFFPGFDQSLRSGTSAKVWEELAAIEGEDHCPVVVA
jgi:hypothetical protein